jgi:amino acid adenylation domain-containing protein
MDEVGWRMDCIRHVPLDSTAMTQSAQSLWELLERAAATRPHAVAVEELPSHSVTFEELAALAARVSQRLQELGVGPGDRVGVYGRKSIDVYAAMLGAMRAGAAYVPVDYAAPPWRSAYILHDCSVKVAVIEASLVDAWRAESESLGPLPELLVLPDVGGGAGLRAALDALPSASEPAAPHAVKPNDLAYILYTSGSTGKPKGVMLTHENALSFVAWCTETFRPTSEDRFSSHAPFHFDLSILDLYVPLANAAMVLLIGAEQGKEPVGLARLIAERRLTFWYSTPTILSLLTDFGKMERNDYGALHTVLFAGEVFPVKHLRALTRRLPGARYFNLYGPTETNVCTFHEIPLPVPDDRTEPYPIGAVCKPHRARLIDEQDCDVPDGAEGELVIAGPNVMQGYCNLPDRTARAFVVDETGTPWYRTGDVVMDSGDGVFIYVGRRDRMVKRRGYRIELGEIEATLYRHTAVKEVAAVAGKAADGGVNIVAFLTCNGSKAPSIVELKQFCAGVMPNYMIPDTFRVLAALPKTSTDKMDYQRLKELL